MKLKHRSHKSPVDVKFKFSEELAFLVAFSYGSSPRVSKCLTGTDGVNRSTPMTWKILFFKLKMTIAGKEGR